MFDSDNTTKRLSTNEKLNRILNGREDDNDDEGRRSMRDSRAKQRLARSVLYGTGVRGNLPTVKKKKALSTKSHILFTDKDNTSNAPILHETSVVPPGAHDDLYRMVRNNTACNEADVDKLLFTSTTMTAGIRYISQPPWYLGHQNKVSPSDDSIVTSAVRYGFRGSKDIRQYQAEPYMSPIRTRTEHTPKFLATEPVLNEWVPPLKGAALNRGHMLTTPKMWPENAEYVTGYPKRLPTSAAYVKETTVASDTRPVLSKSVDNVQSMFLEEESRLLGNTKLEMTRSHISRPMTEQMDFRMRWNQHLSQTFTPSQNATRTSAFNDASRGKSTLLDPTDSVRYAQSGATAVLIHTQSSDVLKYRSRLEQSDTLIPYALRWTQLYIVVSAIRGRLRRDQRLGDVVRDIAMKLHVDSMSVSSGEEDVLVRPRFLEVMSSVDHLSGVPVNQLNLLYSAFDYTRTNAVRLVDLINALMLLDTASNSKGSDSVVLKKLTALWYLFDTFSHRFSPLETCLAILTSAAACDEDRRSMTALFKEKFRPMCFRRAIMLDPVDAVDPSTTSTSQGLRSRLTKRQSQGSQTQFAYNVCDPLLDCDLFLELVETCPDVLTEFERQWLARVRDSLEKIS